MSMNAPSNTVLVTGGAGYIGSHTCKALHLAGFQPVVIDNLVHGHRAAARWGPLYVGDISDRTFVSSVLTKHRPAAVVHFAAYAYVGESLAHPEKYYRNNVTSTLAFLTALREHRINTIVFSSTCATYGVPDKVPIAENQPQNPINPYGSSKMMVERILADFDIAYGMKSVVLRYFNAAGADPEGEIGERHDPETHLIPLALRATAPNQPILKVFGNDYETPDGTCIRDYIHVTDLAQAHLLALNHLLKGGSSETYNLANGNGFSIKEVIQSTEKVTGRKVQWRTEARRHGDPPILIGNSSKIRTQLGWRPLYTQLDEIIETAWRWEQRPKR